MRKNALLTALLAVAVATGYGQSQQKLKVELDLTKTTAKKSRSRGCGGAGGIVPAMVSLDMAPVQEVAHRELDLRNAPFNFEDNNMLLIGIMGYGGARNSLRVGGGGWFGYNRYQSEPFSCRVTDSVYLATNPSDTLKDSVAQLHVMLVYGGFMAERGFSAGPVNLFAGGIFGGGALVLGKEFFPGDSASAFRTIRAYDEKDSTGIVRAGSWGAAPVLVFDVHAGIGYAVASWMHVSLDANILVLHSAEGFGYGYESFLTYNPGVRFRILFGNLG